MTWFVHWRFALFLPPFISVSGGATIEDVQFQLLTLGILVPLTAIPSDLVVACSASAMTSLLARNRAAREVLAWTAGLVLIAIAINLHLEILG